MGIEPTTISVQSHAYIRLSEKTFIQESIQHSFKIHVSACKIYLSSLIMWQHCMQQVRAQRQHPAAVQQVRQQQRRGAAGAARHGD